MTIFMPQVMPGVPMAITDQNLKTRKSKNDSFGFKTTEEFARMFEDFSARTNRTYTDIIIKGIEAQMNPQPTPVVSDGFRTFRAPYLSAVPCGPWQEAVDRGDSLTVSTEVADELEARDGDVWVRASGESMEGAGILDGFLILVRPLDGKTPRRGEIVLMQATDENESCVGTVKRFNGMGSDGKTPKLLDGADEDYALPSEIARVDYIGRAVGVIGRL